ncbi:MAG TPA: crossover junction endodeoxyribonuclease RuvC [Thermoanaerobaculia bacterium]|nr:crossover junction endodeoxyribonuclease RuvC [Thermoanaerobaculia bacterium]
MLILGLDPGSLHTGYGLVEKRGTAVELRDVGRISCPRGQPLGMRLAHLVSRLEELLRGARPDLAVLETPFHGLNARSLIVLAEARGALLATLAGAGVEIAEYSPAEVKSAITGNGRAGKDQVARMVRLLLAAPGYDWAAVAPDTTDALALALCCAQRLRLDRLRGPLRS